VAPQTQFIGYPKDFVIILRTWSVTTAQESKTQMHASYICNPICSRVLQPSLHILTYHTFPSLKNTLFFLFHASILLMHILFMFFPQITIIRFIFLSFDWEHIVSQSTHLLVSMYVFNGENILDLKWIYLTWKKKENFGGGYLSMGHFYGFRSILDLRNQFGKENNHICYVLCYMTNKTYFMFHSTLCNQHFIVKISFINLYITFKCIYFIFSIIKKWLNMFLVPQVSVNFRISPSLKLYTNLVIHI